jgi:uncharacterized protein (DUF1697 family)
MKLIPRLLSSEMIVNVSTFLNTGNIILESKLKANEIGESIHKEILEKLKIDTTVFIRNVKQLKSIVTEIPFAKNENDKSKQLVYFLSKVINADKYDAIRKNSRIVESLYPDGNNLFVYYINGVGRSEMSTKYIDKILGVESSGRTINTIDKLIKKAASNGF